MKTIEQLKAELNATPDGLLKKVLENNLKAVTYSDEVINTVLTVFNKYTGKKIGKVTLDKINAELQQYYKDVKVWFTYNWDNTVRQGIKIYRHDATFPYLNGHYDDVEIYSTDYNNNRNLFDENSGLKELNRDNTRISGQVKYIDDVESYVSKKTEQFKAVKECVTQYEKLVKDFRENGVKGIAEFDSISAPYRITK